MALKKNHKIKTIWKLSKTETEINEKNQQVKKIIFDNENSFTYYLSDNSWKKFLFEKKGLLKRYIDSFGDFIEVENKNNFPNKITSNIECFEDYLLEQVYLFNENKLLDNLILKK